MNTLRSRFAWWRTTVRAQGGVPQPSALL